MFYDYLETPIGRLLLAGVADGLELIGFPAGKMARGADADWTRDPSRFVAAAEQLTEYFAGGRREFDLPLNPAGTDFQLAVLTELQRIPYGETTTYRDIAARIGRPKAVRAVGAANGRNPLPIVIPCHRVVGANGHLTGFGGGLDTKAELLRLEQENSGLFAGIGP